MSTGADYELKGHPIGGRWGGDTNLWYGSCSHRRVGVHRDEAHAHSGSPTRSNTSAQATHAEQGAKGREESSPRSMQDWPKTRNHARRASQKRCGLGVDEPSTSPWRGRQPAAHQKIKGWGRGWVLMRTIPGGPWGRSPGSRTIKRVGARGGERDAAVTAAVGTARRQGPSRWRCRS